MPFTDPIVAGDTLVRNAIQSENYVPGVAGWQIRRDGFADFQQLTTGAGFSGRLIELVARLVDGGGTPDPGSDGRIRWQSGAQGSDTPPTVDLIGFSQPTFAPDGLAWLNAERLQVGDPALGSIFTAAKAGNLQVNTDANARATWTHGLGVVPDVILIGINTPESGAGLIDGPPASPHANRTATTARTRFFGAASTTVDFDYLALALIPTPIT